MGAQVSPNGACLGVWVELALDLVWLGLGLGCTNALQMAPKWSPSGAQMAPKWSTERPKSCHQRTSKETQTNGSTMAIYIVIHDQNNDEVTIV